jgi:DNA (cytosine-5)-methyltransferase 1
VVDLFCGVGGLTHGFSLEGFKIDAGIDSDPTCKFAYEKNNPATFICADVAELKPTYLRSLFSRKKILVGCAPCQPYSIYTHKTSVEEKRRKHEAKWQLLSSFSDLIQKINPEIVSMENVPQLIYFDGGRVFKNFVSTLQRRYKVSYTVVNAKDYGVAQRRKRLILFASKYGEVSMVEKSITEGAFRTVREEIEHLPPVEAGIAHPDDPLHRSRRLSDLSRRRIQAMKPGGFWREWDKDLQLDCHKKKGGEGFRSVYGRMKWDDVAPTITTCCTGLNNGRFGHPEQDRAITLREAALLQSFPMTYKFMARGEIPNCTNLARHIGNAVPVNLGRAIARSIALHIQELGNTQKK